ncbi:FGGY-family carbohydrate kinase [Flavobacterium nitrogenifigens]|uniref:Sugar (Pentulose or hexulose) kinase n=1 Tax=Flavobacterium nitrogenifigens TaxID=1617283 RepID=A0A521E2E4_9FLAO|nr:FGGY-family carbohydrate kinase [Flavobacterium nitrogenifigens]KAF2333890.1 carbohydrate kinase [Flavobacterium nitrogenifigens]SMO77481.1 Sugar (pentulose or hexulose) kinase [Flavobacterium nitrogenifigens]
MNVVAIFDIGKTNKKVFLFNENYKIVWEKSVNLEETTDEDGFPCEDIEVLKNWILDRLSEIKELKDYVLKAINFSTYGASFVYIDENGKVLTPLYNYLKDYPEDLKSDFYEKYKGEKKFAVKTASPVLGSLNSGMQIYRIKEQKPEIFEKVKYCLHLPQFLSFLLTNEAYADITSIGCHTNLWNFKKMKYHKWLKEEGISDKIPPIHFGKDVIMTRDNLAIGVGLHDSSSAIIPYTINFTEPFVLLSTGTWSISLNPFNNKQLTFDESQNDCLCYMQYTEKPVKAARLFAGNEHEVQTKRLAQHFNVPVDTYKEVYFDKKIVANLRALNFQIIYPKKYNFDILKECPFQDRDLSHYKDYETAYHQLMLDLVEQQVFSTNLVIHNSPVKKIFVDGGFSKNSIYMNLLAEAFPDVEVYAASMAQASALGAALAIHDNWNPKPIQNDLIDLKFYKH